MVESVTSGTWPGSLPAIQVRFARPTDKLDEIVTFYGELLGLAELHRSTADGWSVVMFGLLGDRYNLEFVAHEDGLDGTVPTTENLLVLYFENVEIQRRVCERLRSEGVPEVALDNPWWLRNGAVAVADPDGWRIVLMPNPVPLAGGPCPAL